MSKNFVMFNFLLSKLPVARTTCGVHPCSHICAIIGGLEECFCPAGLELAAGSTTDCTGKVKWWTPPSPRAFWSHSLKFLKK